MVGPLRNLKHEHFAQLIAGGETVGNAYHLAGYSDKGAPQSGARLLRDAKIGARVEQLRTAVANRGAEKASVDRARVLCRLDELSREAQQNKQFNASIRAEELLGKELGMFRDKLDISGSIDIANLIVAGHRRAREGR